MIKTMIIVSAICLGLGLVFGCDTLTKVASDTELQAKLVEIMKRNASICDEHKGISKVAWEQKFARVTCGDGWQFRIWYFADSDGRANTPSN